MSGASAAAPELTTHGYCPTCEEESAIDGAGCCLWCGGATVQAPPPEPKRCLYTEAHLVVLRRAYDAGEPVRTLAKRTYARVGYENAADALQAIERGWLHLGFMKKRTWQCAATLERGENMGQRCGQSPLVGSEYCRYHEPARRSMREEAAKAKRAARRPDTIQIPIGPFTDWLSRRADELGSWTALAASVERNVSTVHRYGKGLVNGENPKTQIRRHVVDEFLAADGSATFKDLYPDLDLGEEG